MMVGILLGIFGNSIYDIIKSSLKDKFIEKDYEIVERVYSVLEEVSQTFFNKYKSEFGEPSNSFLARETNIDTMIKIIFYDSNLDLVTELSNKGFDGSKDVSEEALSYFVSRLYELMMKDFQLNKIITEKKHIIESQVKSNKIIDMLQTLVEQRSDEQKYLSDDIKTHDFKDWVITDENGNTTQLIEGKQYNKKIPNGLETKFMLKNELIYVEIVDVHNQISYYELDLNGNVKNSKFPYDISQYKLLIPEEEVVCKNVFNLPNGFRRELIKIKWDKQAEVIYNKNDELQNINLSGGWEIRHFEKLIMPK